VEFSTTTDGNTSRTVVSGRLDHLVAPKLESELDDLHMSDRGHMIVDLATIEFLDSAGLAVLAKYRRLQESDDRKLSVVLPLAEAPNRVFEITGFADVFDIMEPNAGSGAV
jgi:stage II sporulation protein AA (anti-sigma F factor antagonist)